MYSQYHGWWEWWWRFRSYFYDGKETFWFSKDVAFIAVDSDATFPNKKVYYLPIEGI